MHRLGFLRVALRAGTGGIRPRPTVSRSAASAGESLSCMAESSTQGSQRPHVTSTTTTISSSSSSSSSKSYLSTSTRKRYEDIPKRIYQSAPKRSHGKHAGMKKWTGVQESRAAAAAKPQPQGDTAEKGSTELALGTVGGGRGVEDLKEIKTGLKEIRVSPWNLNLLAKLVRGLPVLEATAQLKFCKKKHTITVNKAIQNALNLADIRYGLGAEELEVGEIFVTKGKVIKRIRIMGRGRAGIARRKWSHLNVTLREIDFDKKIEAAPSRTQREKLLARKEQVSQLRLERGEQAYADPA